jgi:para-nitrobenzyl esterase
MAMSFLLRSLYLLIFLFIFFSGSKSMKQNDVIKTDAGLISGIKNESGDVIAYKGIPYAAAPTGNLRWKAPQPALKWDGIKQCTAFAASAMQAKPVPFMVYTEEFLAPPEPLSEDCLYLNVWTGAKPSKEKKPVIVWIHGGAFTGGSGSVPIYDGEAMARKGVVFVTINYRLGVFGFFAHPELTKESGYNSSGNYGLLDQIAALKWVQKNIAAFGGDPGRVTIAGQSAGSMSVNCLVASPLAKGLFHRAIAESGASFVAGPLRSNINLQQAEEEGLKIAQSLKVNSIEALRNVSPADLMQKVQGLRSPIADGYVLPEPISRIFTSGKQNHVSLLTGWNADEGFIMGAIKNAVDFKKQLEQQYGADAENFLKFYPAANDAEAAASQQSLSTDLMFGIQNYTWANVQSQSGKTKVYVYYFTRKLPATGDFVKYGAFHTGEVAYAYNNLKFLHRPWEAVDHKLAGVMSSYWVNFAATGNPNGKGLPRWPQYQSNTSEVMILSEQPGAKKLPRKAALDFLYEKLKAR